MIVCVGGRDGVDVYEVGDRMGKKGWNLNSLQVGLRALGIRVVCAIQYRVCDVSIDITIT